MDLRRRPARATVVFGLVAVACAVIAFSLMRGYAARLEALRPAAGPLEPVVVAAVEVARGATLAEGDVEVIELPEAFTPAASLREPGDAMGRVTLTSLEPGEVLTPSRLVGGDGGQLAASIPPDLRAVPIVVPVVPEGLVAGDRVDVLATYGEGRMYAETVGHEVELLVDPGTDEGGGAVGTDGNGTQLVVLADTATATRLARSSVASVLSIAVVGIDGG